MHRAIRAQLYTGYHTAEEAFLAIYALHPHTVVSNFCLASAMAIVFGTIFGLREPDCVMTIY